MANQGRRQASARLFGLADILSPSRPSSFLGIHFDLPEGKAHAARITASEALGLEAPVVRGREQTDIPHEVMDSVRGLALDSPGVGRRWHSVCGALTHLACDLAQRLIGGLDLHRDLMAVGVSGASCWQLGEADIPVYQSLFLPEVFAESTGVTVIDDFPARDLAQGGWGGPVEAHGLLYLLADRGNRRGRHWRAMLDLNANALTCTVLPPLGSGARPESLYCWEIGPGTNLYRELLASAGVSGLEQTDSSRIAVQGSFLPELCDLWERTAGDFNGTGAHREPRHCHTFTL